jgi:hypothetical protein
MSCETAADAIQMLDRYGEGSIGILLAMLLDYNLPSGEAQNVLSVAIEHPALKDMRKAVIISSIASRDREPADLQNFLNMLGVQ